MSVRLTPEAEADLAEAHAWYQQRRHGLGDEFLRSVDAALAAIQRLPEAYPVVHRDIRRVLVRRFPYALLYQRIDGHSWPVERGWRRISPTHP